MTDSSSLQTGKLARRICFAISLFSLAACSSITPPPTPELSTPASFKYESNAEVLPTSPLPEQWWLTFDDPKLTLLITSATENSPSLEVIASRLDKAAAAAGIASASLLPDLNAQASAIRQRSATNNRSNNNNSSGSRTSNRFNNALGLGWEIDTWGRVRHLHQSATEAARAQAHAYEYARVVLQTEVADSYYRLRFIDLRIEILNQTTKKRSETLELVKIRTQSGLADEQELAQAKTEYATTQAELVALERHRSIAENQLALLCGAFPADFSIPHIKNWQPPSLEPIQAIPSLVLTQRGDIAESLALVRAASERVGATQAEYYPRITLTGELGVSNSDLKQLYGSHSIFGNLGPSLSLPIFNAGLTEARVNQAQAEFNELAAAYRRQVLSAFNDVENALASLISLEREIHARATAVSSAKQASHLARTRYTHGLASYLQVIDTERALLQSELNETQARAEQISQHLALIRAIGG